MKEFIIRVSKYLDISSTTAATILVTILVFVLGIFVNQFILRIQSYRKRKTHRQLCRLNHKLLLIEVFRQSQSFKEFSSQLRVEHRGPFVYTFKIIPALAVFKELGYENLFKAYLTGFENLNLFNRQEKVHTFHNLWKTIEYIFQTHSNVTARAEGIVEQIQQLNELRNNSVGKVQNIVEDFRIYFHRELALNEPLGKFYDQREKIIFQYTAQENHTLPHHTNDYVTKLLELNRGSIDLVRKYERDIRSVELNTCLLESILRFENMVNYHEASRHYFEYLSSEYINSYYSLTRSYRNLNPFRLNRIDYIKNFALRTLKNKLIILS